MEIFEKYGLADRTEFTKISHHSAVFDESPFTNTRRPSAPPKRH
jgi:hypothetical protein